MICYEELYQEVKKMLSEERFHHSEGVVKRALEYGEIYHVEKETLMLTAIAHDIAKEIQEEECDKYLEKYQVTLDEIEKLNHNLVHAKLGAAICKERYHFTEDMVNAIKYHTTGRENMSMLEKIIYLADATEENRKYQSAYYVDIIKKDINRGMMEVSRWSINHLAEKTKLIHLNGVKCYNYYLKMISDQEG